MNLRYASLCSGISCESVAWRPLGWTPVFFAEIDPFACAVLAHHYPDVPNLGDMTKIDGAAWRGKVDVLIAGSPCQSFSTAGKRGSLSDARGNLALVYARIVNDADVPVSVFENVPGILATKDQAFGHFLGELVGADGPVEPERPNGKWPGAGLVAGPRRIAAFRTMDAQFHSLAQRRRRVFVVSVRAGDGINPGAILFEPESLPRDSAPGREAGASVARSLTSSTGGASAKEQQLTFVSGSGQPLNALPATVGTLCSQKKGGLAGQDALRGHLVPLAFSAKNSGGRADEPLNALPGDEPLCMAHGQGGAEVRHNQCPTLNCNHEAPIAFSAKDHGGDAGEVAPTLRAMPHHESHMNGGGQVAVAQVYPLQEIGRRPSQNGSGVGSSDDPMFTLQAGSQHGIAHTLRGEGHDASEDGTGRGVPLAVALRGRDGGNTAELGGETAHALRSGNGGSDKPHVMTELAVRRLTPRETERLQGLPDDYTLIPYGKGARQKDIAEMAAYWGMTVEEAAMLAADSHRYRAVGNGMAAPVVRWIGERIERILFMQSVFRCDQG